MNKRFSYIFLFLLLMFISSWNSKVYAAAIQDFIAQPYFETHTLSTGEVVSYKGEGRGGNGTAVRQYKNQNYEQFFVNSAGIWRREDTSWMQNGADVQCTNGNRAIMATSSVCTDYTEGQSLVSGGHMWLPAFDPETTAIGTSFGQSPHQIVTIDSGLPLATYGPYNFPDEASLKYCPVLTPNDVIYNGTNACNLRPSLTFTGYYLPGTYTFCSGVTNPEPVVTLSGTTGAGAGDGFAYMEGCGLVGFSDANLQVGITSGCGISGPVDVSSCTAGVSPESQTVTATFSGTVRTVLPTLNPVTGKVQSGAPVHGANIGFYQGRWDNDSGNIHGNVFRNGFVATDGQGKFSKTVSFTGPFDNSAYIFLWCGDNYADGWKIRLDATDIKKDFFVPCGSNKYTGLEEPPTTFNLSNMGDPLACGLDKELITDTQGSSEIAPGYSKPIILEKPDFDTSFNGKIIGSDGSGLPPRPLTQATIPFPGRNNISKVRASYSAVAKLAGTYGFGRLDPQLKGTELKDTLESCEAIRQCNDPIGTEGAPFQRNMHTCYSYATKLAYPGMWEQLYSSALALDPSVCLDSGGNEVKLSEIEPPSDLAYLTSATSFKYEQARGDYFPYLYLLGDPSTGTSSQGLDESTSDSFTPKTSDIAGVVRDDPLAANQSETSQKTWLTTEIPASGRPEFSRDVAAKLANTSIAQADLGTDPLAATFNQPYTEFGYGDANINDNVYAVAGNSDFQIGRPYQLCSRNVHDENYAAPLSDFDSASADAENNLWAGGFDYISADPGLWGGFTNCLNNLSACVTNFFLGFFGDEEIDPKPYDTTPVPAEISCPNPTQETFSGNARPSGPCVSWNEQGSSFACDPVSVPSKYFCEVASCVLSDGTTQCDDNLDDGDDRPALCADPNFDGTCTYRIPYYTCNCSLRVEFQANVYNYRDLRDSSDADAFLDVTQSWGEPFKQYRACGSLTTTDYEVTDQEDQDYATSAFNSGGPGCTEDKLGELINTVADPVFGTDEDAPGYNGVMSN